MKYTVTIQWSPEDDCFVIFIPDFKNVMQPVTRGDTYQEAIDNAYEVMELLTETATQPFYEPEKVQ